MKVSVLLTHWDQFCQQHGFWPGIDFKSGCRMPAFVESEER